MSVLKLEIVSATSRRTSRENECGEGETSDSSQLPLTALWIAHNHAQDLAAMSALLDAQPALTALAQPR